MVPLKANRNNTVWVVIVQEERSHWKVEGKMETNDEIEELALDKMRENRSTMVTGD